MKDLVPITKAIQTKLGLDSDGIIGPDTLSAVYQHLTGTDWKWSEDAPVTPPAPASDTSETYMLQLGLKKNVWPLEANAKVVFGYPPDLITITPPYGLRMFDDGRWIDIPHFKCNTKVADSLMRVLTAIKLHYGSQEAIKAAGMDVFDGCYNDRSVRGSSKLSMHALGAAVDFNADKWPLGNGSVRMPDIVRAIFHYEGWRTGDTYEGRKDPMHAEACR